MEGKEYWDGEVWPDVGRDGEADEDGGVDEQLDQVPHSQVVLGAGGAQLPASACNEVDIGSGSVWKTDNVTASGLGEMLCARGKPEEKADETNEKVEPDGIEA